MVPPATVRRSRCSPTPSALPSLSFLTLLLHYSTVSGTKTYLYAQFGGRQGRGGRPTLAAESSLLTAHGTHGIKYEEKTFMLRRDLQDPVL